MRDVCVSLNLKLTNPRPRSAIKTYVGLDTIEATFLMTESEIRIKLRDLDSGIQRIYLYKYARKCL